MSEKFDHAPGSPGAPPVWTSSRKQAVGTARNPVSRVWFTVGEGILNEIYYPRIDCACTRDFGLIVTDGQDFFSEEKSHTDHCVSWARDGVPAFEIVNTCTQGKYRIHKRILADPYRHVLMQSISFEPAGELTGRAHLYALLAPHLKNRGENNTAWAGQYKGIEMLMAEREGTALALACSHGWLRRSVGYVGSSDGWQDLSKHKQLTTEYQLADNGNVALTGEINLLRSNRAILLALGFGRNTSEAALRARASLLQGFEPAWQQYCHEWQQWQSSLLPLELAGRKGTHHYRASTATIGVHEAKDFGGAIIASLSIPWGSIHGDKDAFGYHVVWPRDAYEAASAMLAAGAQVETRRALSYSEATQESDGHWPQNMWLDGTAAWNGRQLDEVAAPLLLLDLGRRKGLLQDASELSRLWPMVQRAAAYIVGRGPVTEQDRWEETAGYSPYTLGSVIAGLLIAASMAEEQREPALAQYLLETADAWNDSIERWCYATGTELGRRYEVEGYYVRLAPPRRDEGRSLQDEMLPIQNRRPPHHVFPAAEIVSPDALALVRFGLRAADDPRIRNTLRIVDAELKVDTPCGPSWRRYSHDGYGEHPDGSPFDGAGVGRLWPLLTAERAHYELAVGHRAEAERLLAAVEAFAGDTGLLSEQVWDGPDLPEKGLFCGKPTGSARPLVWAHAEHIKLLRSLRDGAVFDLPVHTFQRYVRQQTRAQHQAWRFNLRCSTIRRGKKLRIENEHRFRLHWTADGWRHACDRDSLDSGLGLQFVDLPTTGLQPDQKLVFTFYWPDQGRWEGKDYEVTVAAP